MELSSFDESNVVLDKPDNMSYEECSPASVFRGKNESGQPVVISCWKPTREELEEIQRTGRVWLTVLDFTMPPAYVSGVSPWKT